MLVDEPSQRAYVKPIRIANLDLALTLVFRSGTLSSTARGQVL